MDLGVFEKRVYSQNGEDGVIEKLIDLVYGDEKRGGTYVEFGVENGSECNTRFLRENYEWKGLLMDGGHYNPNIFLMKEFVTKENIVELFKKYNVPTKINMLSIDIDFNDFYVLHQILKNYTFDIIVCEYNSTHDPTEDKIVKYDPNGRWDCSNYFGASLLSFEKLANSFNYSLVYCEQKGVNCFFVRNSVIADRNLEFKDQGNIEKIYRLPRYGGGPKGGHHQDAKNREYISFNEAVLV